LTLNIGESKSTITSFVISNHYDFPVLMDGDAAVTRLYGVSGVPITFFIDRSGVIKYIKRGEFLSLADLQNALNTIA
jgi:cytochrome c biogenesis protein CcmG/thiol:disulfide interchange protein DsbE